MNFWMKDNRDVYLLDDKFILFRPVHYWSSLLTLLIIVVITPNARYRKLDLPALRLGQRQEMSYLAAYWNPFYQPVDCNNNDPAAQWWATRSIFCCEVWKDRLPVVAESLRCASHRKTSSSAQILAFRLNALYQRLLTAKVAIIAVKPVKSSPFKQSLEQPLHHQVKLVCATAHANKPGGTFLLSLLARSRMPLVIFLDPSVATTLIREGQVGHINSKIFARILHNSFPVYLSMRDRAYKWKLCSRANRTRTSR